MQVRFLGREDPLEEGMQPTPIFLPGESHGQRSLAGYKYVGLQRVRHDLSDLAYMHNPTYFHFNT